MTTEARTRQCLRGVALLGCATSMYAQEAFKELPGEQFPVEVSCEVKVSNTSPLPFEPVTALIRATYDGSQPVVVTSRWFRGSVSYARLATRSARAGQRDPLEIDWKVFPEDLLGLRGLPGTMRRTLSPGQVFSTSRALYYDFSEQVHVTQEPGELMICGTQLSKVSEPALLTVRTPTGKNRKPWETLRALDIPADPPFLDSPPDYEAEARFLARLPIFLSSGGAIAGGYFQFLREVQQRRGFTPSPPDFEGLEARLRGFARNFPDSDYAPLALLGVGHLWLAVEKPLKARDAFLDVWGQGPPVRAAEASYYLGVCEERLGNKTTAADRYRQVLQGSPDPVTRFLAQKGLEDLGSK